MGKELEIGVETLDTTGLQNLTPFHLPDGSLSEDVLEVFEPVDPASLEAASELRGNSLVIQQPLTSKQLAELYGVSPRTVQNWVKAVCEAYCWIPLGELKTGTGNNIQYSLLCQGLIAEFRGSQLGVEAWIESVHAANPDKVQSSEHQQTSPQASSASPGMMVPLNNRLGMRDRSTTGGGLMLLDPSQLVAGLPDSSLMQFIDVGAPADFIEVVEAELVDQDELDAELANLLQQQEEEIQQEYQQQTQFLDMNRAIRLRTVQRQALIDADQEHLVYQKVFNARQRQNRMTLGKQEGAQDGEPTC